MTANESKEMKAKIRAICELDKVAFVQHDAGRMSGLIIIQSKNQDYKKILSKFVEIDNALTEHHDADILDTHISISFPDPCDKIRVTISYVYD